MKIFDCFMYFDEDIVLDVRLNYLDKYINVVENAIEHNKKNQTQTKTLLTNMFGNN